MHPPNKIRRKHRGFARVKEVNAGAVGRKAGVSARYIQSLEAGEYFPSLPKLVKLKLVLRCGWAEIFNGCEKV
jgi:transcriptional regulator with XRE-family HTH domain